MSKPRVLPERVRQQILADFMRGERPRVIAKRYGVDINYPTNLARARGLQTPTKARIERAWERARRMAAGYDPQDDFARSLDVGAAGGEPWKPSNG